VVLPSFEYFYRKFTTKALKFVVQKTGKDTCREVAVSEAIAHLTIEVRMLDAEQAGIDHLRLYEVTH
jgi:hypothetical protein